MSIYTFLLVMAFVVVSVTIIHFSYQVIDTWKSKVEVDKERVQLSKDIFYKGINLQEAETEVDKIIIQIADQYCLLYINNRDNRYIKEKEQVKMREYVKDFVNSYMTEAFISKIKLFCKYETEEELSKFLDFKIAVVVMSKIVQYNSEYTASLKDGIKKDVFSDIVEEAGFRPNF